MVLEQDKEKISERMIFVKNQLNEIQGEVIDNSFDWKRLLICSGMTFLYLGYFLS